MKNILKYIEKKEMLVLVLIVFLVIYYNSESRDFGNNRMIFNSPDENLVYFFSNLYVLGSMVYELPEDVQNFSDEIKIGFMPRDGALLDNKIVPQGFLGQYIIYGVLIGFDKILIEIINPLFGVVLSVVVYLLVKEIFNKKIAAISILILLINPVYWIYSSKIMFIDIVGTFFLIMGVYSAVKVKTSSNYKYAYLSAFFFFMSVLIRYFNILLVLPFIIYLLAVLKKDRNLARLVNIAIIALFVLLPIPLLNEILYGAFYTTGYSISYNVISFSFPVETSLIQIDLDKIISYISLYYFNSLILTILGLFFGLLLSSKHNNQPVKIYTLYTLYCFFIITIYFGSRITWGFEKFDLNASFLRYSLPFLTLGTPFIGLFFSNINIPRSTKIAFFLVLIVLNIHTVFNFPGGIKDSEEIIVGNREIHDFVIKNTENNSIILTRIHDKVIFPERLTLIIPLIAHKEADNIRPWDFPVDFESLGKKVLILKESTDRPVYILYDKSMDFKNINNNLYPKYSLMLIKLIGNVGLYKVIYIE